MCSTVKKKNAPILLPKLQKLLLYNFSSALFKKLLLKKSPKFCFSNYLIFFYVQSASKKRFSFSLLTHTKNKKCQKKRCEENNKMHLNVAHSGRKRNAMNEKNTAKKDAENTTLPK